jgi:hypothetical protein
VELRCTAIAAATPRELGVPRAAGMKRLSTNMVN